MVRGKKDHVVTRFLERAEEFRAAGLWKRVLSQDLFLVRVPGEEEALAVSLMGAGGGGGGLSILRGPGALDTFADLLDGVLTEREYADLADVIGFTFEAWGDVEVDFQQVLLRGMRPPRREQSVPEVFVSRPFEMTRAATRSELRLATGVLAAIVAAEARGEFEPKEYDSEREEVLELTLGGSPSRPDVSVRVAPWPAFTVAPPALPMLPADLSELPRLGEDWLMTRRTLPVSTEDDGRTTSVFMITDGPGLIRAAELAPGEALDVGVRGVQAALRGGTEGLSRAPGRPRKITFDDASLFDALAPALGTLGIDAELVADLPALDAVIDALIERLLSAAEEGLGEPERPAGPKPMEAIDTSSVEYHKQRGSDVTAWLMSEVTDGHLMTERASKRYFGPQGSGPLDGERAENLGLTPSLIEWLVADYRPTKRSKTLVEKLLAKKHLDPFERRFLEARRDAHLSFFRVVATHADGTLELEDILTGETHSAHDLALSQCGVEGFFLPLRLLDVGDWVFPAFAGPPLSGIQLNEALAMLEAEGLVATPTGLRRDAHLLGRLWEWTLNWQPPRLCNTDGHELELQTAVFGVQEPAALLEVFESREDIEFDEGGERWVLSREGGPSGFGERTTLASMKLSEGELSVEVNSRERLEGVKSQLEKLPGVRLRSLAVSDLGSPESQSVRKPRLLDEPLTLEDHEVFREVLLQGMRSWADTPAPVFDGKTPRQACATAEGRRKVERLVRTWPAASSPGGPIEPPRDELLGELGLL